jgi:hypothetical protein
MSRVCDKYMCKMGPNPMFHCHSDLVKLLKSNESPTSHAVGSSDSESGSSHPGSMTEHCLPVRRLRLSRPASRLGFRRGQRPTRRRVCGGTGPAAVLSRLRLRLAGPGARLARRRRSPPPGPAGDRLSGLVGLVRGSDESESEVRRLSQAAHWQCHAADRLRSEAAAAGP